MRARCAFTERTCPGPHVPATAADVLTNGALVLNDQATLRARRLVGKTVRVRAFPTPKWGYTRSRGALSNIGHDVGRTTIKQILADHGIEPAPERGKHLSGVPSTYFFGRSSSDHACDIDASRLEVDDEQDEVSY